MMEILGLNSREDLQKTQDFLRGKFETLFSSMTETITNAKTSLSETIADSQETLDAETTQGVHQVTETTAKAKTSLSELVSQRLESAKTTLSQTTGEAIHQVSELTDKAKNTIRQTTDQGVQSVQQTTNEAMNQIQQAADTIQTTLSDQAQHVQGVSNAIVDSIENVFFDHVQHWLHEHRFLAFFVNHPWISFFGFLALVVIFFNLLKIINSSVKNSLIGILTAPFNLLKSVLGFGSKSVVKAGELTSNQMTSAPKLSLENGKAVPSNLNPQQRISQILTRLEELQKEQNQLLQELSKIVKES